MIKGFYHTCICFWLRNNEGGNKNYSYLFSLLVGCWLLCFSFRMLGLSCSRRYPCPPLSSRFGFKCEIKNRLHRMDRIRNSMLKSSNLSLRIHKRHIFAVFFSMYLEYSWWSYALYHSSPSHNRIHSCVFTSYWKQRFIFCAQLFFVSTLQADARAARRSFFFFF